jgi:hypothetical protein
VARDKTHEEEDRGVILGENDGFIKVMNERLTAVFELCAAESSHLEHTFQRLVRLESGQRRCMRKVTKLLTFLVSVANLPNAHEILRSKGFFSTAPIAR